MSEGLCVRRLHFSKEVISHLCEMLQGDFQPRSTSCRPLSVALKFNARRLFQAGTGDMCNITQNAARVCIQQVTEIIFRRVSEFIGCDMSPARQRERPIASHRITGFPRVQGAVDGTHVPLKAPRHAPVTHINRKRFHSLNVMILCDADLQIMNVNVDHRGSAHDTFVLRHSNLEDSFTRAQQGPGWVLSDEGYPLKPWLMTSYHRTNSAAQERYYHACVCTRQVVERTIGVLESCFRTDRGELCSTRLSKWRGLW
ncbi:putative nuclease HARBI1 [Heptranchias perlo]|uniref:putative nuclease HARBI1 n=1 Tax=Heptranchias perlo TaxID=212740 RepID=UPI00355A6798